MAAAVSEHELHPRGRCHDEAELLVEAQPVRSGAQVNAVGSDTPGPVDDVADQPRSASVATVLRQGDDVREPDGAPLDALGIGDAELEGANSR